LSTFDRRFAHRRFAACCCLLAAAVTPAMARAAAEPTASEQARAKAVEAQERYEAKDFAGALARLEEAKALFPSPKLQFNFALVYRALGRDVDALAACERFLADAPDADTGKRATAARHAADLRRSLVAVEIFADADDAQVFIDGQLRGSTPLRSPVWVVAGPHQISLRNDDLGLGYSERIEGAPGAVVRVDARLALLPRATSGADARADHPRPASVPDGRQPVSPWVRRGAWIAAGGSVLLFATGIGARAVYQSRIEDFNKLQNAPNPSGRCNTTAPDRGGGRCSTLLDESEDARRIATGAWIGSAVLAAGAVTAFVISSVSDSGKPESSGAPVLAFGPGELAAGWRVRF
jgi:tetratricopeptide (TPR) repeat protein